MVMSRQSSQPVFPNELLMQIALFIDQEHLKSFLFVNRYTYQLVCQRVYHKAIFPDTVAPQEIIQFCQKHGRSLEMMKLPNLPLHSDAFFIHIAQLCPNLTFLQSSMMPKQLHNILPILRSSACFMLTNLSTDHTIELSQHAIASLSCCSSYFVFPNSSNPGTATTAVTARTPAPGTLTHISHYFHHPGALRNAILPTFGADLLSLTLNHYDVLTATTAELIVSKCPRLRYLVAPTVKAEGLWLMLRWCHSLVTIIVGEHDMDEGEEEFGAIFPDVIINERHRFVDDENERAVSTIKQHKRVWCLHPRTLYDHHRQALLQRKSWHIGIIPKR
ncbi:uncharacterized protein BYT42DRAFT_541583 [Radiomyces spectabilis]|uniref:uncharacterized protein n=1 Tax=Radiomyces spectabilis TaxID=64574 RepID=UPI00221FE099|nr:uncharacterized protein BYT42DRAFT_541583 [Radiomyces spectabilis]KAI8393289.1 hypothetical protein BYT42DRAFT_541583 [Radiomyces spectabilis]